jgi:hypothetical protein
MKECAKKEQRILNTGLHFWEGRWDVLQN